MIKKAFFCFFILFSCRSENAVDLKKKLDESIDLMKKAQSILRSVQISLGDDQNEQDDFSFDDSISLINEGSFSDARKVLLPLSKRKNEQGFKALYLIGKSFFLEKNYERSLVVFNHFINQSKSCTSDEIKSYIKEAKESTSRCFEFIGRPLDSCFILDELRKIEGLDKNAKNRVEASFERLKCPKLMDGINLRQNIASRNG
jgi:hypothetical protein